MSDEPATEDVGYRTGAAVLVFHGCCCICDGDNLSRMEGVMNLRVRNRETDTVMQRTPRRTRQTERRREMIDVMRLASAAGIPTWLLSEVGMIPADDAVKRFAALVLEEAARIAETGAEDRHYIAADAARQIAQAIRTAKQATNESVRYPSELLTRAEAAEYLGVSPATLATWKCTRRYLLPVVMVGRMPKYKKADLDAFIKNRTIGTAEQEKK